MQLLTLLSFLISVWNVSFARGFENFIVKQPRDNKSGKEKFWQYFTKNHTKIKSCNT